MLSKVSVGVRSSCIGQRMGSHSSRKRFVIDYPEVGMRACRRERGGADGWTMACVGTNMGEVPSVAFVFSAGVWDRRTRSSGKQLRYLDVGSDVAEDLRQARTMWTMG